jgi:serine/threonine protein kinase
VKTLNEVIIQLNLELSSKGIMSFQPIVYYISSELLNAILESVGFLHKQKIIHRDLKPANILITNGTNGRFIKIADFDLAKVHEFVDQSHTQGSGTPKYMAPEVFRTRKYDNKADIYSLGVIIRELFGLKPEAYVLKIKTFINI